MRSFLLGALFSIVSVAGFSRRFQPVHGFGTGGPKPGGALDGGKPKSGPRSWGKGFSLNDDGAAGGGKSGGATTPSTAPGAKAPGGAVGRGQTLNPLPGAKNTAPVGGPQGVGTAAANTGAPRGTAPETPPKAQREREVAPTLSREDDQKFKTVDKIIFFVILAAVLAWVTVSILCCCLGRGGDEEAAQGIYGGH